MSPFPDTVLDAARAVIEASTDRGLTITTAESCTGGLIAAALTEIPGSSAVIEGGFVTYSNEAKAEMIDVPPDLIVANGAVSEPVAVAMAEGARRKAGSDIAVSVTGVAGPGGGSALKPIGLVHLAVASCDETLHRRMEFGPLSRSDIRMASVGVALELLRDAVLKDG